jgi:UDP-N-acetylmuramate--alanine ligase
VNNSKDIKSMHIKPSSVGPIHFVGIGGIGMSGIAEILYNLGYSVQGSDLVENYNIHRLQKLGIKIFIGQRAEQVEDVAVLVVSSAVKNDNVELIAARQKMIPIVKRAEMLAEIMRLKPSIAIAGTHGKTTTTSLVACVLDHAHMDPTVINGGIINAYGTNARLGKGEWIVAESDESDGSFTRLPLIIGIITNIEADHLDYYKDLEEIKLAFEKFIHNIPFYGLGIVCIDHPVVKSMLSSFSDRRILTYGFSEEADLQIQNIFNSYPSQTFDLHIKQSAINKLKMKTEEEFTLTGISLPMVGKHNVSNAVAALAVGLEIGIEPIFLKDSFTSFEGVKRRFTKVAEIDEITIIDDYAHHLNGGI